MSEFRWWLYEGDCLEVLRRAPDNYFDSMCTDPPAGISFMHREWDGNKGGRDHWIDWMCKRMQECYRVLKPGAHALVWALPRTSHWTATALEDAGWEVRDIFTHHYGSGFPKSQDVGKFIDKLKGAEREVVGVRTQSFGLSESLGWNANSLSRNKTEIEVTTPATDEAARWNGWGTGIKPGSEHWILVRKPLSEKSVARNVLKWGTGALNIDTCRVHRDADDVPGWHKTGANGSKGYQGEDTFKIREMTAEEVQERCGDKGRWPTNLLLSHSEGCQQVGVETMKGQPKPSGRGTGGIWTKGDGVPCGPEYGGETVDVWECAPDCPVAEINRQSGYSKSPPAGNVTRTKAHKSGSLEGPTKDRVVLNGHGDSGGASRFFPSFRYQAKPSRSERERGLEALPDSTLNRVNPGGIENDPRWGPVQVKNNHPTVKSAKLMAWLCRLITPPGGLVLDPFCGSGSTGVACLEEGFRFVGIEQDPSYCEISRGRIGYAETQILGELPTEADPALTETELTECTE